MIRLPKITNKMKQKKSDKTKIGTSEFDSGIWSKIEHVILKHQLDPQEILENFPLFLRRVNFAKLLSHIELFNLSKDLPGAIVELGVFKGASFMTFVKLCDILCSGDTLKRVIGFDTWQGFIDLHVNDGPENKARDKIVGGFNADSFFPVLQQAIDIEKEDSFIPRFHRAQLIQGDCRKTIPEFIKKNPGLRISLLHLDLDLYEPTLVALEQLYPLVVTGGVVILDEYAMEGFPGESKAIEHYFKDKSPKIRKFPYISTPGGYFIK